MREIKVKQGSAEWLSARVGLLTASRMGDVMAKRVRGNGELACRRDYRMELVCERLTGRSADHYVSPAMDRGTEQEPYARAAYELATETMVDVAGFVLHPTMDFFGASPDSLVDSDGGLEIKCPNTSTHIAWKMAGVVPEEHRDQMMANMICCERQWWDFCSMDDRLPQGLRFFVARLHRDEKRVAEMEFEAIAFNAEIEAQCAALGYPDCTPKAPNIRARSTETVRIGGQEVPADIADMVGEAGFRP